MCQGVFASGGQGDQGEGWREICAVGWGGVAVVGFNFFWERGEGGEEESCVESGTFFFQYAGCNTTWTYLMSRGVSC